MALNAQGIEVPAGTDAFDPQQDLVDLATSLEGRIIVPVANTTARGTLATAVAPTTSEPLFVYRTDQDVIERTVDGTTFRRTAHFAEAFGIATFPLATAATHIIPISFPAGVFTSAPIVTYGLVADSSASGIIVNAYSVSATGITFIMTNVTGGTFSSAGRPVHWHAFQATSGAAAG